MTAGQSEHATKSPDLSHVDVIVASLGRPDCLATLARQLHEQTQRPRSVIYSVVSQADLPSPVPDGVIVVFGPKGSPAQRNTGLDHLPAESDVVIFLDDDFVPSRFLVERAAKFFADNPDVVGANGVVLADGINSPGIGQTEAEEIVARDDQTSRYDPAVVHDCEGLYGCNMAYRASAIGETRFDERLKLYGWQEDIDFAARVGVAGRIVKSRAFAGVHRGAKGARTSGVRLGYSQVSNPLYLIRKGSMTPGFGLKLMARNVIANHLRALRPEPWVDRVGRVRGNWLGFADVIRGRFTPERIERL